VLVWCWGAMLLHQLGCWNLCVISGPQLPYLKCSQASSVVGSPCHLGSHIERAQEAVAIVTRVTTPGVAALMQSWGGCTGLQQGSKCSQKEEIWAQAGTASMGDPAGLTGLLEGAGAAAGGRFYCGKGTLPKPPRRLGYRR
jgi:hypothetical protein